MKYLFTFKEINYGCIEIEDDHKPDSDKIIEKILEGMADYSNTNFTDVRLFEIGGNLQHRADESDSCV